MFRTLLRLVVIVVVLIAIAVFFFGYRLSDDGQITRGGAVGTAGRTPTVDTSKARDTGAAIGERVAQGASDAQQALANGALTAKIKSKIALDDTIKDARIDVDTAAGLVTMTGTVASESQRQRALQLARETDGVRSVTDKLTVR